MKKALLLFFLAIGCSAYTQQKAVDDYGNAVRRLTFDRENVSVVYAAGDSIAHLHTMNVTRQSTSDTTVGIITVEPIEADSETLIFDLNGRKIDVIQQPGIYIEKRGTRIRKIVKIK